MIQRSQYFAYRAEAARRREAARHRRYAEYARHHGRPAAQALRERTQDARRRGHQVRLDTTREMRRAIEEE